MFERPTSFNNGNAKAVLGDFLPLVWVKQSRRILRSPLPKALRRRLLWTNAVLLARTISREGDGEIGCKILNFEVRAYSVWTLAFLFREIFVDLDYYFETEKTVPFIIDGGSNLGMAILFFKTLYPQAVVAGFEPARDAYALLTDNLRRNNIDNVKIHPFALGASEGKVSFFEGSTRGSLVGSTNPQRISETKTTVQQVPLSRFIDREVDLLKLDIEGDEMGVLRELIASGAILKVSQMIIEYHHHIGDGADNAGRFLALLEGCGYGYQLRAIFGAQKARGAYQDVLVYAYRKS